MDVIESRVINISEDDMQVVVNEYTGYLTLKGSPLSEVKIDLDDLAKIVPLLQEALKQVAPTTEPSNKERSDG